MSNNIFDIMTIHDDPDEKEYLILLSVYPDPHDENSNTTRDWCIRTGRQLTYDYLKELVRNELIDPMASFIISGDRDNASSIESFKPGSNLVSVFRFLKVMRETSKVLDGDEFSIDDYLPSNYSNGDPSIFDV